jgi:serine/threonine protein phosphatase PrpC
MHKIISSGKSDIGLKRSNNEDAFVLEPDPGFFALADGMGGAASGEVASHIFVETALEVFSKAKKRSEQETLEFVQNAFRLANDRILNRAREDPHHHGMGCTAELIVFCGQNYVLGHVGDSRTYLFRQGQLRQITRDQSLVQDQIDKGLITPAEARRHSLRNVILTAVGVNEMLALDLIRGRSVHGDLFLLCSDGLTDMVDDASIQNALSLPLPLDLKVEKLIDLAKSAGGYDNITVILCEVIS